MLSLSLKFGTSFPSNGKPSITHNGSCGPEREAVPRILILLGEPGEPVSVETATPAICPLNN